MAPKPKPRYASKRELALFGIAVCALFLGIYGWVAHSRSQRADWPQTQAAISELRTRLTRVSESTHGTIVVYQAEAHVNYTAAGKRYDPWLPILWPSSSRRFLEIELSRLKEQSCYVHWDPARPDHAFLTCNWSLNIP